MSTVPTWVFPPDLITASNPSPLQAFGPVHYGDVVLLQWTPASAQPQVLRFCRKVDNSYDVDTPAKGASPYAYTMSFVAPTTLTNCSFAFVTGANDDTTGGGSGDFNYVPQAASSVQTWSSVPTSSSTTRSSTAARSTTAVLVSSATAASTSQLTISQSITAGSSLTASSSSTAVAQSKSTSAAPAATAVQASSGLSSGAKAGIGVGVSLGVLAILAALAIFFFVARKKKDSQTPCAEMAVPEREPDTVESKAELSSANYHQDIKRPVEPIHELPSN